MVRAFSAGEEERLECRAARSRERSDLVAVPGEGPAVGVEPAGVGGMERRDRERREEERRRRRDAREEDEDRDIIIVSVGADA